MRLQGFRQFRDTTFEVDRFNVLVGPNNCGKTSVLHAVRAFFLLMHGHVRFEGSEAKFHRRFLAGAEELVPTPDMRELWYERQFGKPLTISVTFDDDTKFSVVVRQQFGQIHVSADILPEGLTAQNIAGYLGTQVAFIPGLVGVLVTEPYATRARRNALATQGRYSEIFRSSLHQLKQRSDDLLTTINTWLSDLFDVTVSTVNFDAEADEFVTVKYKEQGREFDVVSSGAGLQQVIQMLTYLYLAQPRILLVDEPDAHLHSKLQARLGELFRRAANDLDAQVFLSTHSLDLIDTFSTNEVLVVDSRKSSIAPIGKSADLVSAMVDADIVDVSALSRLLASRQLVVIEDKDQTILKAADKAIGSPLFSVKSSSYVLPAKGVGNFRAIAQLGTVLKNLTGTAFDLTFVQDRDGMPDFLVEPFLASQKAEGVAAHLLQRHEIENYLLEPELFSRAAKLVGRTLSSAEASKAMREAASNKKPQARRVCLETAKQITRQLPKAGRLPEGRLEETVYAWFDALDLSSLETVQHVFPGKETLGETLRILNEGKKKRLSRGHLVASMSADTLPADLAELLRKVSGTAATVARRKKTGTKRRKLVFRRQRPTEQSGADTEVKRAPKATPQRKSKAKPKSKPQPKPKSKTQPKPKSKTQPKLKAKPTARSRGANARAAVRVPAGPVQVLNAKERAVVEALASAPGPMRLAELGATAFPQADAGKANSWARNSLRKPGRLGWVQKTGKGKYETTPEGEAAIAAGR